MTATAFPRFNPRLVLPALAATVLLLAGCPAKPAVGTLSGRVTNQGKPVTDARILFENAELGAGTMLELDADGRFTVATADGPGLPPGIYKVAIKPKGKGSGMPTATGDLPVEALAGSSFANEPPPKNDLVPDRFNSFDAGGLQTEIRPGANPSWDIDLGK